MSDSPDYDHVDKFRDLYDRYVTGPREAFAFEPGTKQDKHFQQATQMAFRMAVMMRANAPATTRLSLVFNRLSESLLRYGECLTEIPEDSEET